MATSLMPAAFIGHGSPMNALHDNRYTAAWRAFGRAVPTPRAILVISAHWYINATAVTAMARPRTIHDFYGFPQELFDVQYPAPGLPDLADEIADIAEPTWVGADVDSWGIDHGSWSVLAHAFPDPSIPVVQLAINAYKPLEYHVTLGAKLAALRQRGVLIVGSGNIVHNLGAMDWRAGDGGFDWARHFDDAAKRQLLEAPGDALQLREHGHFDAAAPTPDHFIPLLYFAGLAAEAEPTSVNVLIEGCAYGSISMTSYTLGLPECPAGDPGRDDDQLPADVPGDASNM
jgi:4,5-DOPA dioxygenase extradiol